MGRSEYKLETDEFLLRWRQTPLGSIGWQFCVEMIPLLIHKWIRWGFCNPPASRNKCTLNYPRYTQQWAIYSTIIYANMGDVRRPVHVLSVVLAFAERSCHLVIYPEIGQTFCTMLRTRLNCFSSYPTVPFLSMRMMTNKFLSLMVRMFCVNDHPVDLSVLESCTRGGRHQNDAPCTQCCRCWQF